MSRICDNCKKQIPLGTYFIRVNFIGIKYMEKLFGGSELDFCSLTCLATFWELKEHPK